MATEAEWQEQFMKRAESMARVSQFIAREGTIPAITREAIKDIRNTIHEVFFGAREGAAEPGAPLNPIHGQGQHPFGAAEDASHAAPSPAGVAQTHAKDGQVLEENEWTERILEERKGSGSNESSDQNERAKGRSLPDEQREQREDQDRGGRGR